MLAVLGIDCHRKRLSFQKGHVSHSLLATRFFEIRGNPEGIISVVIVRVAVVVDIAEVVRVVVIRRTLPPIDSGLQRRTQILCLGFL